MRAIDVVCGRTSGHLDTLTTRLFDCFTGSRVDDVQTLTIVMNASGPVYATAERYSDPGSHDNAITEVFLVHSIKESYVDSLKDPTAY